MPDPQQRIERTDALVIGGGPIGLLVAAQLLKFKCSAIVVEKDDKPSMPIYGRATTLWCRTLELLDQLDLCEPLMEVGCFTKDGINFRDGKAAPGGSVGALLHASVLLLMLATLQIDIWPSMSATQHWNSDNAPVHAQVQ